MDSIGKSQKESFGKHHKGILLESLTKAYTRTTQGLHKEYTRNTQGVHKGFLLERLTQGIVWNTQGIHNEYTRNTQGIHKEYTKGFYWKASHKESFGKHHKGILLESVTKGILVKEKEKEKEE